MKFGPIPVAVKGYWQRPRWPARKTIWKGQKCPLHIGQSDMSLGVFVAVKLPDKVSGGEQHHPQVTRTPEELKCLIRISRVTFQR